MKRFILVDDEDPTFRQDVTEDVEYLKTVMEAVKANQEVVQIFAAAAGVYHILEAMLGKAPRK